MLLPTQVASIFGDWICSSGSLDSHSSSECGKDAESQLLVHIWTAVNVYSYRVTAVQLRFHCFSIAGAVLCWDCSASVVIGDDGGWMAGDVWCWCAVLMCGDDVW